MAHRLTIWPSRPKRFPRITWLAACVLTFSVTACVSTLGPPKSDGPLNNPAPTSPATTNRAPGQLHSSSMRINTSNNSQGSGKHIVLPNRALIGCQAGDCSQVLSDKNEDPDAIYPWQVLLDFNGRKVIGLIAFYDQPTSIDDVQAAVDERYGKWATASFRTGAVRLWRVEPEEFAIQLAVADSGMVQLIYLIFDPKHPASSQAEEYQSCLMEKSAKCAAPRRWYQTLISPFQ